MERSVAVNGIQLACEVRGAGPPLLLIAGLGCARWMWWRNLDALARDFTVVAFDHRGVGASDKPDGPYSMAQMAEDARGLLDALGIERADVLGISMGGYIAQELALAHPERLRRLVLGATSAQGALSTPQFQQAVAAAQGLAPEPFLRQILPLVVAPGYWEAHPQVFESVLRMRLAALPPAACYAHQAQAAYAHDSRGRVTAIDAPTLVLHGAEDCVVPPAAGRALAQQIPGAGFELFAHAGHYFFAEQAAAFHRRIGAFLLG